MIKMFSKYLAKKWLDNHKDDTLTLNLTNKAISTYELYKDMGMYFVLYILCMILLIIGFPIGIFFLTGYSFGWLILSFVISIIVGLVMTFKILGTLINTAKNEIISTLERINKKDKL